MTSSYEKLKQYAAARNKALSLAGRDIGELPPIIKPKRKIQAAQDFRFFCEKYFPATFYLPWSADHLKVIDKIEQAVLRGGLFAMAMPRGAGKSSLAEMACLWAILYGHREFVCLIGSDEGHAAEMLDSIKMELECNDLLLEDFPEATYPIQKLEGIANRCSGQLYFGDRTHIEWTAKYIVLPSLKPRGWSEKKDLKQFVRDDGFSLCSGAIVQVAGITGSIRGMKFKRPDGKAVRPSLVVIDDPQTDESARSLSQCATREAILAGAVLGLAGPGRKISGIMPCTVIRSGDMADNILNRDKHPEWNGERMKLIYSFPTNERLWEEYARLRTESFKAGHRGEEATEFYRQHQQEMDAGAIVAWPARYNHDELSAIQHAMNLKLRDERAFWAEYQNEPLAEQPESQEELTIDVICEKINRMQRGTVPLACNHLTMFIDVQQKLLFFVIAAWEDDFTGYVIEYGVFPKQHRHYFTLRDAKPSLAMATRAGSLEGAIYAGLEKITSDYLTREFQRDDGALLRIERCLIDANWGQSTDVVYQFCRQSAHAAILMPSHGRFIGASSRPLNDYHRKPGDRIGLNWRIPNVQGRRAVRYVIYDTNFWKSFIYARLAVAMGNRGCLSLFGQRPEEHRLFAEHLMAEYRVRTEARGRIVDEWKLRPSAGDNHWFDCLVGCAVAASIQGVGIDQVESSATARKERISFAKLQRLKRQAFHNRRSRDSKSF